MIIELKVIKETDKAYQLKGNGWIPKSILDNRGLIHPYYQVKPWFLAKLKEEIRSRKATKEDKLTLESLNSLTRGFKDLPEDVIKQWNTYWRGLYVEPDPPKRRKLNHYNDIGAITDISFQDIYGDFGY